MRIALLGTRGVPARYGGFETAAEEIGRRLAERGHEVVVYCRNPGQTQTEYLGMRAGQPARACAAGRPRRCSHTMLSVGHAIAREHPDVAFVFNAANAPFLPALRAGPDPGGRPRRRAGMASAPSGAPRASALLPLGRGAQRPLGRRRDRRRPRDRRPHARPPTAIAARYIPYGAPIVSPGPAPAGRAGRAPRGEYHLVVARFEPENHVREIVAGYVASDVRGCRWWSSVTPPTPRPTGHRSRLRPRGDPRVRFLGSLWDTDLLDTLYAHATTYLHGHSVGGTNPSLLRAMGAGAPVTAYDVVFNREVAAGRGRVLHGPGRRGRALRGTPRPTRTPRPRAARPGRPTWPSRYRWDDVADALRGPGRGAAQYAPWPVMTALAVLARMTRSSAIDQCLDVVQVHAHAVLPRDLLAPGDLPQPGESRLGEVPAVLGVTQQVHLLGQHRPGADQGHRSRRPR